MTSTTTPPPEGPDAGSRPTLEDQARHLASLVDDPDPRIARQARRVANWLPVLDAADRQRRSAA